MDREREGRRLGDFLRKTAEAGKCYCLACKTTIAYGSKGFEAIRDHITRKGHRSKIAALDKGTTVSGELGFFLCFCFCVIFFFYFFVQVLY